MTRKGRVLFECGQNEELVVQVVDLDRVTAVREWGTRGLSRVWKHLGEAPAAVFEPYRSLTEER
ncbi:MAG: hypothetical protein ACT4PO_11220 [Actinomycetota bacterium]